LRKQALYVTALVLASWGVVYFLARRAQPPVVVPGGSAYQAPVVTYTPPSLKLPWTKDKAPLPDKALPVPASQVAKSISLEMPGPAKVDLIIDKKGDVYKAVGTDPAVKITVTKWRPPLFAAGVRVGPSVFWQGEPYFCLSVSLARVGRFYAGVDLGASSAKKLLAGPSIRYKVGGLSDRSDILLSVGWNAVASRAYVGLTILF
jgi:hypothetical protein